MSSRLRFAARKRKRRLAAPFFTTVFLGATACTSGGPATTPPPKAPVKTAKPAAKTLGPTTLVPPLPPAKPEPKSNAGGGVPDQVSSDTWGSNPKLPKANGYVTYNRDGTCFGVEKFDCPKAAKGKPRPTCNPPAPRAVQCPPKPSPLEIADARKQSFKVLAECEKLGALPKNFSVEISAAGSCSKVFTVGKLDKRVLNCAREKLKKLGWPLNVSGYQIEIK